MTQEPPPDNEGEAQAAATQDAGLAGERTFLAWNRTALAFIVVGAAVLRFFPSPAVDSARDVVGISTLVIGSLIWIYSYRHYEAQRRAHAEGRSLTSPGLLRLVALGTAGLALAAFVLALFPARP